MKERIIKGIIDNIRKESNYDETKLKEIKYGLETIYVSIVKLIIILIISIFLHTIKELCVFYLLYVLIRLTGFGLHAKNTIMCYLLTIPLFVIIPYLIKILALKEILYYITIPFIIILAIYAPADTEKRPLINSKKRKIYKILTILISITYLTIILLKNNYLIKNSLFFSIILESILVLPITYKLLGLKYANYKRYKRKEVT